MHNFSKLLITLPVMILPLAALSPKPALAETVGIERALELLAKSTVVDRKCSVLTVPERDELSIYIAKAEVAAAERTTVQVTRSALAAGKSQGQAVSCGAEASREVRETLVAARDAIKRVESAEDPVKAPALANRASAPEVSLAAYGRIIEIYYLERRCTYLSKRKINAFYKAMVRGHRAVVAEFGKPAVWKVMKSAEARSNYQRCNDEGEARVISGFDEIASR